MTDTQHQPPSPTQIKFDNRMACIPCRTPTLGCRWLALVGLDSGRVQAVVRVDQVLKSPACNASAILEFPHADAPSAVEAGTEMRTADQRAANRTLLGARQREGDAIDRAGRPVFSAPDRAGLIPESEEVAGTVAHAVHQADSPVVLAHIPPAGSARRNLIRGKHRVRLIRTACAMLLAHQPARAIRAPQMARAVQPIIHQASHGVVPADVPLATAAAVHVIQADPFVAAAFTANRAIGAQPPRPKGRFVLRANAVCLANLEPAS